MITFLFVRKKLDALFVKENLMHFNTFVFIADLTLTY